ncbi:MAG: addiction module antidote protein, HigA family [Spirochaetales bacterium]|nr:MAG: addiction module antidote protein, HigA family [Spirochaetales bacterium]
MARLFPMGITAYRLAKDTGMPPTRVSQILKGRRRITADTALRLSRYFGNSAEFWLGIQNEHDLRDQQDELSEERDRIPRAVQPVRTQAKQCADPCADCDSLNMNIG